MEKEKKFQKEKIGGSGYINKNCWLVKTVNYPSAKRCCYCESKFRHCLFFQYLIVSLALIIPLLILSFLIEGKISKLIIVSIFVLVIVYGYFFSQSTEKIVKANFFLKKTKDALKELTDNLEEKVDEQTKDIRQKNKYLQELLNMKSEFLRVVNHQLNTPLSIMRSAFGMAEEKNLTPDQGIQTASRGLERMSRTIADFWEAYQLEGEKIKMNQETTDITKIIERLIEEKQGLKLACERELKISVEWPKFKIPLVWCDPKKITHAISNLLDNAVFYTPKGSITVSYELAGKGYLKVNIKDTGAGISQENKKRLFEKFSRGQGATELHPDGSGLGLYIARKIVEGNDGIMTHFSAGQDQGSTFSFTIPIYADQKPVTAKYQKNNKVKTKTTILP